MFTNLLIPRILFGYFFCEFPVFVSANNKYDCTANNTLNPCMNLTDFQLYRKWIKQGGRTKEAFPDINKADVFS